MGIAGSVAYGSGGLATAGAYALALYGADQTVAGFTGAFTGRATRTLGSRVFDPLTGNAAYSEIIYGMAGAAGSMRATQSLLARRLWTPLGIDTRAITGLAPGRSAGELFEESVTNTFRRKIIRRNEVLRDTGGRVIGEIDFETAEAICEVGTSLRGKVGQLHKLAAVARQRGKRKRGRSGRKRDGKGDAALFRL